MDRETKLSINDIPQDKIVSKYLTRTPEETFTDFLRSVRLFSKFALFTCIQPLWEHLSSVLECLNLVSRIPQTMLNHRENTPVTSVNLGLLLL